VSGVGTLPGVDADGRGAHGRLRRAFGRWTSSREELAAAELRTETHRSGATPVSECADRVRAEVRGVLRTVTLRPRAGVPALEAELFDGSGAVTLVWLGRRRIAGVEPGRGLEASGLLTYGEGGRRVMYNPRYTLEPAASA
jgi:hypothetical protein